MCTHSIFGSSSRCCHSLARTCSYTRTRLNKTRLSLSHSPIDSFSAYRSFPHMTGRCCSVLFADQLSTILSRSLSPHTHTLTLSFSRRLLSLSLSHFTIIFNKKPSHLEAWWWKNTSQELTQTGERERKTREREKKIWSESKAARAFFRIRRARYFFFFATKRRSLPVLGKKWLSWISAKNDF